ncbi:MAG: hypothetical protein KA116_07895 [Proteobacteria bacterium]|nr:hypothetical protein [Pseudomonadota bacterium]
MGSSIRPQSSNLFDLNSDWSLEDLIKTRAWVDLINGQDIKTALNRYKHFRENGGLFKFADKTYYSDKPVPTLYISRAYIQSFQDLAEALVHELDHFVRSDRIIKKLKEKSFIDIDVNKVLKALLTSSTHRRYLEDKAVEIESRARSENIRRLLQQDKNKEALVELEQDTVANLYAPLESMSLELRGQDRMHILKESSEAVVSRFLTPKTFNAWGGDHINPVFSSHMENLRSMTSIKELQKFINDNFLRSSYMPQNGEKYSRKGLTEAEGFMMQSYLLRAFARQGAGVLKSDLIKELWSFVDFAEKKIVKPGPSQFP